MNLFDVYPVFDIEPVKGEGSYVFGYDGTKYLDLYGGHAVISIGHSHPHYVSALNRQLSHIGFYSNSVKNSLQSKLAQKLGQMSGYQNYQLFLCNSGTEANENALKLASFYNQRKKLISFKKGFHGRTSGALGVTDNPDIKSVLNKNTDVIFLPLNDFKNFEQTINNKEFCAVIVEGIQGIGGVHIPEPKFLKHIAELCRHHDTVLILDEVQSGYGRSGKFFAHQYAGIQPDIITTAKGMGNGFPIGGVLIHPKFQARHGMLGTTFGGNYLACTAGLAVLEIIEMESLVQNARDTGKYIMEQLQLLNGKIKEVRGIGLLIGIEFTFPGNELRQKLLSEYHIITGASSEKNTIRILPPLNIKHKEADIFLHSLEELLKRY